MKSNLVALSILALAVSAFFVYSTEAAVLETKGCSTQLAPKSPASEVFACMRSLESQIAKLSEDVSLARRIEGLIEVIPRGAVLAFDLARGCPKGWSNFEEADGRFLLGVEETYLYRREGGEEEVTLKVKEMPAHSHTVAVPKNWATAKIVDELEGKPVGNLFNRIISETNVAGGPSEAKSGEAKPHNNMPPFIVLYFCKKE